MPWIRADEVSTEEQLLARLMSWCEIPSGTFCEEDIARQADLLLASLVELTSDISRHESKPAVRIDDQGNSRLFPIGPRLIARARPQAPRQVLLGIHYDTVYGEELVAGELRRDGDRLLGPGVADAKGGIVVMLAALAAFENRPESQELGWELFLNADEEIGSPSSREYFASCGDRFDFAMLFEPALADGSMAIQRKGSGNYTWVVRGRAAHAGRDFSAGRNAIVHATKLAQEIDSLNGKFGASTFNVARIVGGGPLNVVPDLCVLKVNVRVDHPERTEAIESRLRELTQEFSGFDGLSLEPIGAITSPPKYPTDDTWVLARSVEELAERLDHRINWIETGGTCDGNKLAAYGLPTLDTFGPRGGELHSPREWMQISSLVPRAQLAASLLLRHAQDKIGLSRFHRNHNNLASGKSE